MGKRKKPPLRKCIGCQEMKDKRSLTRIVKTPEGDLLIDSTGKKNGRGAYICPKIECFDLAKKNKGLERSFKISIPSELYNNLKEELNDIDK
ncbi:MAG: RNase P modulator RnpM [Eubacteriales bacterium]